MRFGKHILALAVIAAFTTVAGSASAQEHGSFGQRFFASQYSAPTYSSVSPMPVPAWVGHTQITYPPLNPYQFLYPHTDRYHQYFDNGRGLTSTRVHYGTSPIRSSFGSMGRRISLPR